MSAKPILPVSNLAALRHADWHYNEDADEMNVLLPGAEGRPGRAVLVNDEFYVRLDTTTGHLLSIIIPAYTHWQAKPLSQPGMAERLPLLQARVDSKHRDAERQAIIAAVQQLSDIIATAAEGTWSIPYSDSVRRASSIAIRQRTEAIQLAQRRRWSLGHSQRGWWN